MKKIVFHGEIFYMQRYGGISNHFFSVIELLVKVYFIKVDIIIPKKSYPKAILNPSFERLRSLPKVSIIQYQELAACLSSNKVAYIHATYYNPSLLLYCKNVSYTFHDAAQERFFFRFFRPNNIALFVLRQICFTFASKIAVVSLASLSELNRYFPLSRMRSNQLKIVVGNGVDKHYLRVGNSRLHAIATREINKLIISICYIGLRGYYKNFRSMVVAVGQLSKQLNVSVVIKIVGGPSLNKSELSFLSKEGLNWEHLNPLSRSELADCIVSCDIFLHPSIYEGFGMTVLEAMALSVPVVAVNISSVREFAGDTIIYASSGSPDDITLALANSCALTPSARHSMLCKAHHFALSLSWNNVAYNYSIMFDSN